jgi:hypothetical protein
MDLGAGTVLRTVLPGLIDTTINIFDVSPIETTNTMHNAVDVRHTHADLQPVVSRANHFDRRCCCDNLIVMPRCTCALAAAAQSAPGQRIDGRKGLAAACVFTNWRWTRPTCAFLRTTTMQVVQQTLVCGSAAKWIDAFRSRGTGRRPSATIGHSQRSMWQEQATPKRSRTIWLGAY